MTQHTPKPKLDSVLSVDKQEKTGNEKQKKKQKQIKVQKEKKNP